MAEKSLKVGTITDVSGEVNIAAGDIYTGFTAEQVSALLEQLTQIASSLTHQPFAGHCPYKGLDVFEEEDAELFFGREKIVNELIDRLRQSSTLFVTGPSGSGKSSLIRAGLIPALKKGAIDSLHSERWKYQTIHPGRDPLDALATAFSRLKSPDLANYFRQHITERSILSKCIEATLSDRDDDRLVLFIDQFEEVLTQVQKDEADIFINLLTDGATFVNRRVSMLFALRSDFVSNCAAYPHLNALLNRQFFQVGAMQPNELVSAIAQPALHVKLRVDPALIVQIINDMQGEPGTLPLMQFALKDLFEAEHANRELIALTRDAYLQRGGIHKSLERHADDSFAKLDPNQQELARAIFGRLVEISPSAQKTRRTALFEELVPSNTDAETVKITIQKLATARLVTTDSIRTTQKNIEKDTVTLAHEKLIEVWPWLRNLVNENHELIALLNQITEDAQAWEDHDHDVSYLYSGTRLNSVEEKIKGKDLNEKVQAFLRASVYAQNENRRKSEGLRAIYELTSTLTATLSYKRVLDSALDLANTVLSSNSDTDEQNIDEKLVSAVFLFRGDELHIGSAQRFTSADMRVVFHGTEGVLKRIIEERESVLTLDIGYDPELGRVIALRACTTAYILPLRSGFNIYGAMLFAHPNQNYFTQERCSLLDIIGRQSVIAVQNARLYQDLVEEKERMIEVQEETRKKLARDLHDGPTQSVAAIAMRINLVRRMLRKDREGAEQELLKIEELAHRTTKEVRHMLFTLRPLILESQGLTAALDAMAEKMRETFAQNVIVNVDEAVLEDMEMGKQGVIFYIIEEAVNNARKHANALHIWVRLRSYEKGIALLEIEDDGVGFDVEAMNKSYDQRGSLGLINLRERTELINGRFTIDSTLGNGTLFKVYIPLTEDGANRLHYGNEVN